MDWQATSTLEGKTYGMIGQPAGDTTCQLKIDRSNVLNNRYALSKLEEHLALGGLKVDGEVLFFKSLASQATLRHCSGKVSINTPLLEALRRKAVLEQHQRGQQPLVR